MKKLSCFLFLITVLVSCDKNRFDIQPNINFDDSIKSTIAKDLNRIKSQVNKSKDKFKILKNLSWDFENVEFLNVEKASEAILIPQKVKSDEHQEYYSLNAYTNLNAVFVSRFFSVSADLKVIEFYSLDGRKILISEFNNISQTVNTYTPENIDVPPSIFLQARFVQDDPENNDQVSDCGESYGQAVADCIAEVYTCMGWLSVWAWVQTAYLPITGVAIVLDCAYHKYPDADAECYEDFGWS